MSRTIPLVELSRKYTASALEFVYRNRKELLIGLGLSLGAALLGLWFALTWDLPTSAQIRSYTPENRLQVKAMDGSIIYSGGRGPTQQVKGKQIPENLRNAVVATEDRRFFEHQGIDIAGIARAIVRNTQADEIKEGGSTITQQLARTLFLTQERTLWRKFKEIVIATRIEQDFSKEEILTLYLNQVYLGSGAYGVSDAARTYFSKPVEKLTLVQAALIAGLPQAPSRYSPLVNQKLARKRRDSVLKNMVEAGYLKEAQYQKEVKHPLALKPQSREARTQSAYFTAYIESLLPDLLGTASVPGGLIVETTLNPSMQADAQKILTTSLRSYRSRRVSQGAIVTIDPTTGEIRAMVGGGDFQKSQFNRAVQALRQPGSTFKAFVYAAALENGVRPGDVYRDEPTRFGQYEVKNYDRRFYGPMTLVDALKESRNTIAVQLQQKVGEQKVVDVARRMGIKSELQPGLSMALGASEVTLLELTSAYGTLATNGIHIEPTAIRRIVDKGGQVLYAAAPQTSTALSPAIASTMTRMLEQVVLNGTGRGAAINRPAAGKTGTTENLRDLLFVGYTPQLVTGVWLGNDDNTPTRGASSLAAAIWSQYMRKAMATYPTTAFQYVEDSEPITASPPLSTAEDSEEQAPPPQPEPEEPQPSPELDCFNDEEGRLVCTNAAGRASQGGDVSPFNPPPPERPDSDRPGRRDDQADRPRQGPGENRGFGRGRNSDEAQRDREEFQQDRENAGNPERNDQD